MARREVSDISETSEQKSLTSHLNFAKLMFCAVPNGGKRDLKTAQILSATGVKKGVPDILIFDPPPNVEGKVGTAIELKRVGLTESAVSPQQKRWLSRLRKRGWEAHVAFGCKDAIRILKELGYRV